MLLLLAIEFKTNSLSLSYSLALFLSLFLRNYEAEEPPIVVVVLLDRIRYDDRTHLVDSPYKILEYIVIVSTPS